MKIGYILLFVLALLVPLTISCIVGWKLKKFGIKISSILLLLTFTAFIILSARPRFVSALVMDTGFTIPSDYQDHFEYGWPAGFWRTVPGQNGNNTQSHLDLRAVFVDALFWGYLGIIASIPGILHLIRNRKVKTVPNNGVKDI